MSHTIDVIHKPQCVCVCMLVTHIGYLIFIGLYKHNIKKKFQRLSDCLLVEIFHVKIQVGSSVFVSLEVEHP